MEESAGYYGPEGRRWVPQWYRRILGDCPDSEMFMSILEFGRIAYNALPVYLGNIVSSLSLSWS